MSRFAAEQELSEQELGEVCGGRRLGRISGSFNGDFRVYGISNLNIQGEGNTVINLRGDGNIVAGRDVNVRPAVGT